MIEVERGSEQRFTEHQGGADQRRFYKRLINVADERYDEHLGTVAQQSKESHHGKKTR